MTEKSMKSTCDGKYFFGDDVHGIFKKMLDVVHLIARHKNTLTIRATIINTGKKA